jgi:hypothetical protein
LPEEKPDGHRGGIRVLYGENGDPDRNDKGNIEKDLHESRSFQEVQNPKHETRNPKQIQKTSANSKQSQFQKSENLDFMFVSSFDIRISDLGPIPSRR